ncbi:MAG TPA: OmpA family protein [Vicinamibacterales bacterium]|nr:OmpA family protein [Vicinamibacterales bacterium]
MSRRFGTLALVGALFLVTGDARAQAPAGMEETVRPATTSIYGDTGLWFVPTGEVLRGGTWSASAYRLNWDVRQGFTDISHFEGTFAYGAGGRTEIFGAVRFLTRIDRDTRPIFGFGGDRYGGVDNNYPFVREPWIGNDFGDTFIGAKVSLLSESRMSPVALALRGMVKVPTGSDSGSGTGKMDAQFDLIVSKEIASTVEVSGNIGYRHRGDPDEYDLSSGMPFGIGAQFPTRSPLKFTTEWYGEIFNKDVVTRTVSPGTALAATDGSIPPVTSNLPMVNTLMFGATWQANNGFFAGAGLNWSAKAEDRDDAGITDSDDNFGTKFGWQFRRGYHPGVAGKPVPLPPPPPPPAPVVAPQHTLTIDAQCNPCTVTVGETSKITATAQDSIGCVITYQWSAPTGTFANPAQQNTVWTAPMTPGTVPVTVTGTCPTDGMKASDTVNIQVVPRVVKNITFEDVYFDFDRFTLTDAAQRILAQAVEAMRADPTLRIRIEGHTCNIGTAEYNLALGDRRARSVQTYLTSNGIAADRLSTVSFGEEQPKHDNSREETRRLNRRAAMTVQLVAGN